MLVSLGCQFFKGGPDIHGQGTAPEKDLLGMLVAYTEALSFAFGRTWRSWVISAPEQKRRVRVADVLFCSVLSFVTHRKTNTLPQSLGWRSWSSSSCDILRAASTSPRSSSHLGALISPERSRIQLSKLRLTAVEGCLVAAPSPVLASQS